MTSESNYIHSEVSLVINVPTAEAFGFWRLMENFPQFMEHVKEVRSVADNRYLWRVDGPAGTEMEWEANVTELLTNKRISWETAGDADVPNKGCVEFLRASENATELRVRLSYAPPAGSLGHAVATLFGMNPEQQMRDDLRRCKELLEGGIAANAVTRSEVENAPAHKPH